MAIRKIKLLGDPVLRAPAEDIQFPLCKDDRILLRDLLDTLHEFQRQHGFGRGIAAPQIGDSKKVICIDMGGPQFFINPRIVEYGEEKFEMFDDCFSIPHIMVKLERSRQIIIEFDDELGRHYKRRFYGDMSELLQHEVDHLYGLLTVDRARSGKDIWARQEWLEQLAESNAENQDYSSN